MSLFFLLNPKSEGFPGPIYQELDGADCKKKRKRLTQAQKEDHWMKCYRRKKEDEEFLMLLSELDL